MSATNSPTDDQAIEQALAHISAPGSYFTGAERVAIAHQARLARGIADASVAVEPALSELIVATVTRIANDAIETRPVDIENWMASGLDVLAYVELVAVVAAISGIDSYHFGMQQNFAALHAPAPGAPVPVPDPEARVMNAWVPTVGIALAPTALSALPAERAAKGALGAAQYLTDGVIHQYDVEPGRELTRPQMELVASRTSWLNECFF